MVPALDLGFYLSPRAVAQLLGAGSGSAISKQLRRRAESLEKDRKLKRAMRKADKMLSELRRTRQVLSRQSRRRHIYAVLRF
jgi:hypothetical protein